MPQKSIEWEEKWKGRNMEGKEEKRKREKREKKASQLREKREGQRGSWRKQYFTKSIKDEEPLWEPENS